MDRRQKYEQKRTRINLSLRAVDLKKMKEKYGRVLTASEVKEIVLEDAIKIITKNRDPELSELIKQLSKIGNNLNQIARIANQKKDSAVASFADLQAGELIELVMRIRKKIWNDS